MIGGSHLFRTASFIVHHLLNDSLSNKIRDLNSSSIYLFIYFLFIYLFIYLYSLKLSIFDLQPANYTLRLNRVRLQWLQSKLFPYGCKWLQTIAEVTTFCSPYSFQWYCSKYLLGICKYKYKRTWQTRTRNCFLSIGNSDVSELDLGIVGGYAKFFSLVPAVI